MRGCCCPESEKLKGNGISHKTGAAAPYRKFLPTKKAPRARFVRTTDGDFARVERLRQEYRIRVWSQELTAQCLEHSGQHGRCRGGWGGCGLGRRLPSGVSLSAGGGWVGASCTVTAQSHREEGRCGAGRVESWGRWSTGRWRSPPPSSWCWVRRARHCTAGLAAPRGRDPLTDAPACLAGTLTGPLCSPRGACGGGRGARGEGRGGLWGGEAPRRPPMAPSVGADTGGCNHKPTLCPPPTLSCRGRRKAHSIFATRHTYFPKLIP